MLSSIIEKTTQKASVCVVAGLNDAYGLNLMFFNPADNFFPGCDNYVYYDEEILDNYFFKISEL